MANPDAAAREAITIVGVIGAFLLFSLFTWAFKRNKNAKAKAKDKDEDGRKDRKRSKDDYEKDRKKKNRERDEKDKNKHRDDDGRKKKNEDGGSDREKPKPPESPASTKFDPNKPFDDDDDDDAIPTIPANFQNPLNSMMNSNFQLAPDIRLGVQNNDGTPFKVKFHDTPTTSTFTPHPGTSNTQPGHGHGNGGWGGPPSGGLGGGIQPVPQTASIPMNYYDGNHQSAGYVPPFFPLGMTSPLTPNYTIPSAIPILTKERIDQPYTPAPIKIPFYTRMPSLTHSDSSSLSDDELISPLTPIQVRTAQLIPDSIDPFFYTSAEPTKTAFNSADLHYDDMPGSELRPREAQKQTDPIDLRARRLSDLLGVPGLGESLYPAEGDRYNPTIFGDLKDRKGKEIPISPIKVSERMSPIDLNPVYVTEEGDKEKMIVKNLSPLEPTLSPTKAKEKAKRREKAETNDGRTWDELKGRYLSPRAVDLPTPLAEEAKKARRNQKKIEQDDHERARARSSREKEKVPLSPERARDGNRNRDKVKGMKKQRVKVVDRHTGRVKTEEILVTDVSDIERESVPERAKARTKVAVRDELSEGEEEYVRNGKKKNKEKLRRKVRVDSEGEYVSVDEDGQRHKRKDRKKRSVFSKEEEDERVRNRRRKENLRDREGGYYSEEEVETRRKIKPKREKLRHERARASVSDEEEEELYKRYTDKRGQPKLRKLPRDDPYIDTYRKRERVRAGGEVREYEDDEYEMDRFAQGGQGKARRRLHVGHGYQDEIPMQSIPNQYQHQQQPQPQPQLVQADPILAQSQLHRPQAGRAAIETEISRENPGTSQLEREELARLRLEKMDEEDDFTRKGRILGKGNNVQEEEDDLNDADADDAKLKKKQNRKAGKVGLEEADVDIDDETEPSKLGSRRRADSNGEEGPHSKASRRMRDDEVMKTESTGEIALNHAVRSEKPVERTRRKQVTMSDPDLPDGPNEEYQQLQARRFRQGTADSADVVSVADNKLDEKAEMKSRSPHSAAHSAVDHVVVSKTGVSLVDAENKPRHGEQEDSPENHDRHHLLRTNHHDDENAVPSTRAAGSKSSPTDMTTRQAPKRNPLALAYSDTRDSQIHHRRRDSLEPLPSPLKARDRSLGDKEPRRAEVMARARKEDKYATWEGIIKQELSMHEISRDDRTILQEKSMRRWMKRRDRMMDGRLETLEEEVLRDVVRGVVQKYKKKIKEDEISEQTRAQMPKASKHPGVEEQQYDRPPPVRAGREMPASHMDQPRTALGVSGKAERRQRRQQSADDKREIVDVSDLKDEEIAEYEKTGQLPTQHQSRTEDIGDRIPARQKARPALSDKPHRDVQEGEQDKPSTQLISRRRQPVPAEDDDVGARSPDVVPQNERSASNKKKKPLALSDSPDSDIGGEDRRLLTPTNGKATFADGFDDDEELYGFKPDEREQQPMTSDAVNAEEMPKSRRKIVLNEKKPRHRRDSGYESDSGDPASLRGKAVPVRVDLDPKEKGEEVAAPKVTPLNPKEQERVTSPNKVLSHARRQNYDDDDEDDDGTDLFEHTSGVVPAKYRDEQPYVDSQEQETQRPLASENDVILKKDKGGIKTVLTHNKRKKSGESELSELSDKSRAPRNKEKLEHSFERESMQDDLFAHESTRENISQKSNWNHDKSTFEGSTKHDENRIWPMDGENPIREFQRDLQVHKAFIPETRGHSSVQEVSDEEGVGLRVTEPLKISRERKGSTPPKRGNQANTIDDPEDSGHGRGAGDVPVRDSKPDKDDLRTMGHGRRGREPKKAHNDESDVRFQDKSEVDDIGGDASRREMAHRDRRNESLLISPLSPREERRMLKDREANEAKRRRRRDQGVPDRTEYDVSDLDSPTAVSDTNRKNVKGTDKQEAGVLGHKTRKGRPEAVEEGADDERTENQHRRGMRKQGQRGRDALAKEEDEMEINRGNGKTRVQARQRVEELKGEKAQIGESSSDEEDEQPKNEKRQRGERDEKRRKFQELKGEKPQIEDSSSDEDFTADRPGAVAHRRRQEGKADNKEERNQNLERTQRETNNERDRRDPRKITGNGNGIDSDDSSDEEELGRTRSHQRDGSPRHVEREAANGSATKSKANRWQYPAEIKSPEPVSRKVRTGSDKRYEDDDDEFREYHVNPISWRPTVHLRAAWQILKNAPIWSTISLIGLFLYVEITRQLFSLLAISSGSVSVAPTTSSGLSKRATTTDDLGFDIKLTNTLFSSMISTNGLESTSFFIFISFWNVICIPIVGYLIYVTLEASSSPHDKRRSKSWILWKIRRLLKISTRVILLDRRIDGPRKFIRRVTWYTLARSLIFLGQLVATVLVFRQTTSLAFLSGQGQGQSTSFSILGDVTATQDTLSELNQNLSNPQVFAIVNFVFMFLLLNLSMGWYILLNSSSKSPLREAR
ncbi:uncharacterized protein I303_102053 [Kwoniella dejecticola CBS 10117]|uniref:Uncharacterized protein n=1 Tax=Kwoniella dejecticola CBS 10117 TaxID=1296121 RepID=A0A1A6AC23_9TREE|nr:uncharacterized protein I303_01808 [Kwoniella dejecticola CBS 10117]OBR87600.1 hypothetical protein I303_01808 [Kwoniella dejecticola CBS 10117]